MKIHEVELVTVNKRLLPETSTSVSVPAKTKKKAPDAKIDVRAEKKESDKRLLENYALALDEGDTTTTTERVLIAQEEDVDARGTDGMPTRKSTRSRKQVKDNNFVLV